MSRPWQRWLAIVAVTVLLVAAAAAWLMAEHVERRPAQRSGPPALVEWGGAPVLWVLTRQEERHQRTRHSEQRTRFELHGHDRTTMQRLRSRHLLTVHDGSDAPGRILGQQGPVVWLFLKDQPVAVSHLDGSVVGDSARIVERNPGLAAMWPRELKFFTFDRCLIVTTADGVHWEIDSQTLAATGHRPEDPARLERLRFTSSSWNGSFQTADFLTRRMVGHDGRWIGMFSDREAADAADDGFGSHFKDPGEVLDEGPQARRRLFVAQVSKTRAFSEGRHDRLLALTPEPGGEMFLQGAFLKAAGLREAFMPGADGGGIVLHRDRLDSAGRLLLTRVDPALKTRWRTELPVVELHNRWELPERLLLLGSAPGGEAGLQTRQEWLLSVELATGRLSAWNLQNPGPAPDSTR